MVIAIIGILSSVVLASLSGARKGARDSQRLQSMQQVKTALELYHAENGQYPDPGDYTSATTYGWDTPGNGSEPWIAPLVTGGYLQTEIIDPLGKDYSDEGIYPGNYKYTRNTSCSEGAYYQIGIRNLETVDEEEVHPDNPGWGCDGGDRQYDQEYTFGGFE